MPYRQLDAVGATSTQLNPTGRASATVVTSHRQVDRAAMKERGRNLPTAKRLYALLQAVSVAALGFFHPFKSNAAPPDQTSISQRIQSLQARLQRVRGELAMNLSAQQKANATPQQVGELKLREKQLKQEEDSLMAEAQALRAASQAARQAK